MASQIQDLGNGTGWLYVTGRSGSKILFTVENTAEGARQLLQHASESAIIPYKVELNDDTKLQDNYDPVFGYRYYIQSDYTTTAVPNTLTNAVEITKDIVKTGLFSNIPYEEETVSSAVISPTRRGFVTMLDVDTEGSASTDALEKISDGEFIHGDLLFIRGADSGRVVTITDNDNASVSGKNIYLKSDTDFETGDDSSTITLQFRKGSGVSNGQWHEVTRSTDVSIDYGYTNQRADGVPTPVPGVEEYALLASQSTQEREAGVDKGIIEVTGSSVTLTSSFTLKEDPTPTATPIAGDTFRVRWLATNTDFDGNNVTIFGETIQQELADRGNFEVVAIYDDNTGGWQGQIISGYREEVWQTGSGTNSAKGVGGTNTASGDDSFAYGDGHTVSGDHSYALGDSNTVAADWAVAFGLSNTITSGANYSRSAGTGNTTDATALYSDIWGANNRVTGEYATAGGRDADARQAFMEAFGNRAQSTGLTSQRITVMTQCATTNATETKLSISPDTGIEDLEIPANTVMNIEFWVLAVQYSGSAGTAGDFAVFKGQCTAKNLGGTSSLENLTWEQELGRVKDTSGTAQGGTSTTIQLASGESSDDDYHNFNQIYIRSGTSAGDLRLIADYDGGTVTATISADDSNFSSSPDGTSVYELFKIYKYSGSSTAWDLNVEVSDADDEFFLKFTGEANKNIYVDGVINILPEIKYST